MSDEQDEKGYVVRGEERFAMAKFLDRIDAMNTMYELPTVRFYSDVEEKRLKEFKSILEEECKEIDDIDTTRMTSLEVRTQFADLLGDIIVYCTSEAKRWDIPIAQVLEIIMDSNASKLDADGKPIKDERGKFLKGPNYWKPEEKIMKLLCNNLVYRRY